MQRLIYLAIVALSALCVACNEPQHSIEMHDMDEAIWSNAEEFTYDNQDSLSKRDISIVVRYSMPYVADSLPLRVLTISPDSMLLDEPFTLHIPHLADMYPEEHTFVYRSNVVLRRKGDYIFRLTPDNPVEGIAAVGIVVSE